MTTSRETGMEDPWALLRRLKLGREEFCQRLLTMLILETDYPRWNTRSTPSARGSGVPASTGRAGLRLD